ncbi:MAG: endo-1,4-beta-xylanase [Proteobacteria bacterium]|nr:endo-1,4-beta-xylanase [Pseudomonadota bacterium]
MNNHLLAPKKISRRTLLKGAFAFTMLGLTGCQILSEEPVTGAGLGRLAARKNYLYGAAVQSRQFSNPRFAAALKREASLLVPEGELKWRAVHPHPDVFDFSGYRRIAAFAQANGMEMRGHVLVWHDANPPWLKHALTRKSAEGILKTHIQRVARETSPLIREWDVVNEAVHPLSTRADGLRPSLWLEALGPDYVSLAFHTTQEANPDLTLVYNDYGTEYGDGNGAARRRHILNLLQKLKHAGVPVHALGLQSHLQAHRPLGGQEFLNFLSEVRGLGLAVRVTELDLDVSHLPGRMDDRIKAAQNYVRTYLQMVQEGGAVNKLLTWGLSDRMSWLRRYVPGLRGMLPLDAQFQRGPMWRTLRDGWAEN